MSQKEVIEAVRAAEWMIYDRLRRLSPADQRAFREALRNIFSPKIEKSDGRPQDHSDDGFLFRIKVLMRYHGYKKRTAITEITGCKWDTGEHDRIKKLFNRREKELDALFDVCPLVADFPEELPEPILVVDEMLKRRP